MQVKDAEVLTVEVIMVGESEEDIVKVARNKFKAELIKEDRTDDII